LIVKLIARDCDDFETFISPFVVNFDHFLIMIRSKASFAGNIYYHGKLFLCQIIQAHLLAPDVSNSNVKYILWDIFHLLKACFPAAKIENPADTSPEHNKKLIKIIQIVKVN
jgi:hypothetical protein